MGSGKKKSNPSSSGLGRAIINQKSRDAHQVHESNLYTTYVDDATKLRSVTQETGLDEFLNTAQLAATDFTAERCNVKIVQSPSNTHNPFLLSEHDERQTRRIHRENKSRLRVPRRPPWTRELTTAQLEAQEREAFLGWRRGLAQLQEDMGLVLTPFERNLEVWRQLWRVLERSHLVVQIVDARNPLHFRCEDLEVYAKDMEGWEGESGGGPGKRNTLLLLNKSDLLTKHQRQLWADYFDQQNIRYAFYSATNAIALQEASTAGLGGEQTEILEDSHQCRDQKLDSEPEREVVVVQSPELRGVLESETPVVDEEDISNETNSRLVNFSIHPNEERHDQDKRTKLLSVQELEDLFISVAPDLSCKYLRTESLIYFIDLLDIALVSQTSSPTKLVVGLVGYPNVGKSSTINSLLGAKKVSVSATPGKTKHFQTIHLSSSIILCDCPGLVFPQFATAAAELVCDGVLPIDQLREYTGPISLLSRRIPKQVLEATYGLAIHSEGKEGDVENYRAEDLLVAYAIARGFTRSGQGNPDEARAARQILKDYVNAKLLYCHPPPGISDADFNALTQQAILRRTAHRKRAPLTRVTKDADTFIDMNMDNEGRTVASSKSRALDASFFESDTALSSRPFVQGTIRHGQQISRITSYPHQNIVSDDGTPLKEGGIGILSQTINGIESGKNHKKHFKMNKRIKQRSGKGYD